MMVLKSAVEHRGQARVGLHRRVQLVAQAEVQRDISRDLPDVVDEEPVAPAADVAQNLIGRRNDGARQAEHEVGNRIASDVAGEVETPARVVRRLAAGRQPPQVEPVRTLCDPRLYDSTFDTWNVVSNWNQLVPPAPRPLKLLMLMLGRPGLLYLMSPSKPGMPRTAGVRLPAHVERIHGVEVDPVIADPEIVVQVRPQRVRVGEQPVLVHARLGHPGDGNRRVKLLLKLSCQL